MTNPMHPNPITGAALAAALVLGVAAPAAAGDGAWTLQFEPVLVQVYGHDQHVLTLHEIDLDTTPPSDGKTAVNLETDSGLAYRGEVQYMRRQWGWGADFFWFITSQKTADRSAAADGPGGPVDRLVYEIADQSFVSSGPGEVLFYGVLEDTDLAMWTFDLYGVRTLAEKPQSHIDLRFGLRLGDFDNDYRAVVGVEGAGGTRLDTSSNYDLLMGPMVALAAHARLGRSRLEGFLGQSVIAGSVELTNLSRRFTGPFGEMPEFFSQETFSKMQDVAIPITELRFKWLYQISGFVAVGAGVHASAWWDVPVPPGVVPGVGGDQVLHENTVVLLGVLGAVKLTF